jgi:hypothetical protein
MWTDEDGVLVEVATFTQAETNAKDSVLARRLCDEAASRTPLEIQNVKFDPALVHSALNAMALSIRDRDYDRPSSTQFITTPREDGLLTLISLPWMKEGPKNKKFLTLLGQHAWSDASSHDGLSDLAREQSRIPKRKLEKKPVGTIPTTSSTAPTSEGSVTAHDPSATRAGYLPGTPAVFVGRGDRPRGQKELRFQWKWTPLADRSLGRGTNRPSTVRA